MLRARQRPAIQAANFSVRSSSCLPTSTDRSFCYSGTTGLATPAPALDMISILVCGDLLLQIFPRVLILWIHAVMVPQSSSGTAPKLPSTPDPANLSRPLLLLDRRNFLVRVAEVQRQRAHRRRLRLNKPIPSAVVQVGWMPIPSVASPVPMVIRPYASLTENIATPMWAVRLVLPPHLPAFQCPLLQSLPRILLQRIHLPRTHLPRTLPRLALRRHLHHRRVQFLSKIPKTAGSPT